LAFVNIEDSSWGQKSLRSKERANHLAGLFGNRQDVGVPPKIRSEFKTKESFKAGCLHKGRIIHLNRAEAWTVPFVMERGKFGFWGIEGDKPSLTPLNYLLKVRGETSCNHWIISNIGCGLVQGCVICIDVHKRLNDVVWQVIDEKQEQSGTKYGTLRDTSID